MINNGTTMASDRICRSCMADISEAKNVFEPSTPDQSYLIADILMACSSVVVNVDDALPKFICKICEGKLTVAYEFRKQCERSDISLRESLNQHKTAEDIEVKPDVDFDDYYNDDNSSDSDVDYVPTKKEHKPSKSGLKCGFCNKTFRSKNGHQLHMKRHTKEKQHMKSVHNLNSENSNFPCTDCGLTFTNLSELSKHMKEHVDGLVKEECDDDLNAYDEDSIENVKPDEEGKYVCKACGKLLTTPEGLRIHMRRHTGNNLHCCKVCNKSYTKSNHLKRHMHSHKGQAHEVEVVNPDSKDRKVMQCEFCDRKFKYKKSFTHHMQTEHGISDDSDTPLSIIVAKGDHKTKRSETKENDTAADSGDSDSAHLDSTLENVTSIPDETIVVVSKSRKTHNCHVCDAKFVRSNHLTRHMTLHRAVLTHKCDRCDKAFATEDHLSKHMKEDHIDKPYTCTVCNKTYTRGEHLIRHLKVHLNPTELDYKCSVCEKVFQRSDHLARHIKLHLQQDKRHVCNECGKAFNRLDNLRAHQRIHSGQRDNSKLHLCIYCGKEFNNSSNMIVHMRRHTGERPYKCDQCGKGFPRSHDLKCHERTHSGEKPYMCTLCGKAFNKSNKLLRHTRVHTGERPYVCNLCGRAFTQSNDLALHMRRHTGSRPYACGVCPARFIQSGQLKAHRRSTGHWKEIPPDLKGGHRVEPVVPLGDPTPIRFKTHGKKKFEDDDPDIAEGTGVEIGQNHPRADGLETLEQQQQQQQQEQQQQINNSAIQTFESDVEQQNMGNTVNIQGDGLIKPEDVQIFKNDVDMKGEVQQPFHAYASNVATSTTFTNSFTYQTY